MRCDCCPLAPYDDICPESEGEYGIEYKDGSLGCRHPRNWIEKRDNEHSEALGDMGTDMEIEMTLTESELEEVIKLCKHMVGLDYKSPYHRHGKAFYKPYRNYYGALRVEPAAVDKLPSRLIQKRVGQITIWYKLTNAGLAWLGRQLKITIWEVEQ